MANDTPLTEDEIRGFVTNWYRALVVHVPPEEVLSMVADEGLEFRIPEGVYHGKEGFSEIYHNWTHTFFDEVHTVRDVQVTPGGGNEANMKVVVNWQGRVWNPPAARSEDLNFDAYQTWIMERSPSSGRPVIKLYPVDERKDLNKK
jgi:hypothetical protein